MFIFSTDGFVPRWICGSWTTVHGYIHIISDLVTFFSYFAIPILIVSYLGKKKAIKFPAVAYLFAAFILACGTVHLLEAIIFWVPVYRLSGAAKLVTATVSLATVITLIRLFPKIMAMPLIDEVIAENRIKDMFLSNMSHEIRTPLNAIVGYTEMSIDMINDEIDKHELLKLQNIVLKNTDHLLQLLNDIIDLSKIEAGQLELENIKFDLHQTIEDVKRLFQNMIETKNIEFKATLDVPKFILSDETRIRQIIINLISNAIKFTNNNGKVNLDLSCNNNTLIIQVSDTGIGIDEDTIDKIFIPFKQADSSMTRKFQGSGLGLSITSKLCNLLGGNITVQSEPQKGSVFTAKIKVQQVEPNNNIIEQHNNEQAQAINTPVGNQVESHEIIIVDDNPNNLEIMEWHINKLGFSCTVMDSGLELLEFLDLHSPKIIFLDIQMPIMSGDEVIKAAKKKGCKSLFVAMTANVLQQQIDEYLLCGFIDILNKPLKRGRISELLKKYYE